ncbi:hypothetical protein MHBO_002189 [Bonamia ostreae]|uniref:NadR/Ttd14 AAA domain-containing protein n=1 Tax=Bonamia ostreae TaxID=126728 RepID=A0ABV2ALL3_9EUKA
MSNGIIVYPDNFENFQLAITSLQINNEKIFSEFAESVALKNEKDVVVLFDRAIIDGSAYCSDEEFQKMLCRLSRPKKEEILGYYDAVLYLVSAAEGAEDFYDKIGVRYETAAEARDTDKRTLDAWKKHKNLIIFDNVLKSFETKMREVVDAVCTLLKIPLTAKLPRKYILADPSNIKVLLTPRKLKFPSNVLVKSVTIEKTFIKNSGQKEDNEMYTFLRHSKSNDVSRYTLKKGLQIFRSINDLSLQ